MSMINSEWYRIFLHTAKYGNLTKAAQALHITQPSVSYAIKQLEDTLGVSLFDRLSKGVRLTAEGKALLEYVEPSFTLLHAGENKIKSLKQLTAGELRIGASGPIIKHLLLDRLDEFHVKHPQVRIRILQGKSSEIGKRLKEGQIDLGLVHMAWDDPVLKMIPLQSIQDCFVVGSAYRESTNNAISGEHLAQIPLLLLSPGSQTRQFVEQWLSKQAIAVDVDIELSSLDMLVEFAKRGYGAAFVTRSFVEEELRAEQLFELKTIEPIPERTIYIAARNDISLSVIASAFLDSLLT